MRYLNTPDKIRALRYLTPQEIKIKINALHAVIPYFIKNDIGARIRRGKLHDLVFNTLKLKKNNTHYYLLKSVLAAYGIDEIIIDNKGYYAGPPKKVCNPRKRIAKERQAQSFSQNEASRLAST